MTAPLRVRAAAVAALLAGRDEGDVPACLDDADRAAWARALGRLRAAGDRERVARAVVAERFAVLGARDDVVDPAPGARFYARWLRASDAATRARVARGLTEHDAASVAAAAQNAEPFPTALCPTAAWLVGVGARCLGRLPSTGEVALLLAALRGEAAVASRPLVRWERSVRVAGRRPACEAVARGVGA